MITWLPEIIELDKYGNDWEKYFQAVYNVFHTDFVQNRPVFRGKRLGLKKYPEYDGKSATFWHFISEGTVEDERTPDLRRCERIGWPSPIISHSTDSVVRCWETVRKGDKRIILWIVSKDYVVVLSERNGSLLPWTAYVLSYQNAKDKLEREYQAYKKARGTPL
jgi:hypothetical protein